MKHPVSVAELLELHRLGDLYLKWTATPFAMAEEDLQELQEISDRYHINHSSALFSFQKKYQQEMAVHIEQQLDRAIEALPGLEAALAMVPTGPLVAEKVSPAQEYAQLKVRRGSGERVDFDHLWKLAAKLGYDLQGFYEDLVPHVKKLWPGEAVWFDQKMGELGVEPFELDVQQVMLDEEDAAEWAQERNQALREQLHEDNEVDRESAKDHANALREELTERSHPADREIAILRDIANVDELTREETARLDELVQKKVAEQDAAWNSHKQPFRGSVPVPAGVVQDAISTGHIEKIK